MNIRTLTGILSLILSIAATHGQAQSLQDVCRQLGANPTDKQLIEQLRVMTRSLGDDQQKSLSGTLFCLSVMAMGDSRRAAAVKTALHRAFPSSRYTSFLEPAYSGDVCAKCEGCETYRQPCTNCGTSRRCKSCKGTGKSFVTGLRTQTRSCLECRGTGTGTCRSCDGRGFTSITCRSCTNGFAPSAQRACDAFIELLKHGAEGGDIPQIPRATSLRAILSAMDAATHQARTSPTHRAMLAAVAQAQQQARVAINNAQIRISGTIKNAVPNGAARIHINLTELKQCQPELRDDTLTVQGLTVIALAGSASDAALFLRGAKLELHGTPEFITTAIGNPSFPLDCTPIAEVGMKWGYTPRIIGTIVMRNYSVAQSHRIFKSPFATAPKTASAKSPTGAVSADSFGALLCRLDSLAQAVEKAPTTILKNDALAQFHKGGVALFADAQVDVYAKVQDIKMRGSDKVEIAFKSIDLGSYALQPKKSMGLMGASWRISVPMTAARAREVRPGQLLTLHGKASLIPRDGSIAAAIQAAYLHLFNIVVSGHTAFGPDAGIRLKVLSYAIEGNGQDI